MTIEQLNYLLRKELYAIKNHKDNIDRIKKEYFDSNYGLKEGDKIRILHETGDEMIENWVGLAASLVLKITFFFFKQKTAYEM